MSWALPAMILCCLAVGAWRRVPVYDAFLEGAKEGLSVARTVLPALIAMLCAVRGFEASGLTADLCRLCAPVLKALRIPEETLPLMLLRPVSGSASLAALRSVFDRCGPDSRAGLVASVMMGSSETVFYTCAVYLSAAGVKRSRHTVPCALIAWLAGSIAAGLLVP